MRSLVVYSSNGFELIASHMFRIFCENKALRDTFILIYNV